MSTSTPTALVAGAVDPDTRFRLRALTENDHVQYADMLHSCFNAWYWKHGWGQDYFQGSPDNTLVFPEIYEALTPGCSVAAFDPQTDRLMGACFYHPRPHHMSLGIMGVHPNYSGQGVGRALVNYICARADEQGLPLRLVSSAMNMDSFSLYNRAGLVPRAVFHDMIIPVPEGGMNVDVPGMDRVRTATLDDVPELVELELEISGISRDLDCRYTIDRADDVLDMLVLEGPDGKLDGYLTSLKHDALNMIGPGVARTEEDGLALIARSLDRYPGQTPLMLIPVEKRHIVETLYGWGGQNIEVHLMEVRGKWQSIKGVNFPSFLPETG